LQVFYQGGTQANTPGQVNSSSLEVFDLQSFSPLLVESSGMPDQRVSSRYGHLLATWRDGLLLLGGKHETLASLTQDDNNIWSFGVNNRSWQPVLSLPERPELAGDRTFEAADVAAGDTLLTLVQLISDLSFSRNLMAFNLSAAVDEEASSVRNHTVELVRGRRVHLNEEA
jgi:hypothetical protein